MGRDWTPQEYYFQDQIEKDRYGVALRDREIMFHNKITGETVPFYSAEEKDARQQFPEMGFLFDNYYNIFQEFEGYPLERNVLFAYIEALLKSCEDKGYIRMDYAMSVLENMYQSKQYLFGDISIEEMEDKIIDIADNYFVPNTVEKWFRGELTSNFYYSTENNELFAEKIKNTMQNLIRQKEREKVFQTERDNLLAVLLINELLTPVQGHEYILNKKNIPSYKEAKEMFDYEADWCEEFDIHDYEKMLSFVDLLPDYVEMYDGYLQLNDNHTLWSIPDGVSLDDYNYFVSQSCQVFEEVSGQELLLLGRSGRHVCVDAIPENFVKYNFLCDLQGAMEQDVIDDCKEMVMSRAEEEER